MNSPMQQDQQFRVQSQMQPIDLIHKNRTLDVGPSYALRKSDNGLIIQN